MTNEGRKTFFYGDKRKVKSQFDFILFVVKFTFLILIEIKPTNFKLFKFKKSFQSLCKTPSFPWNTLQYNLQMNLFLRTRKNKLPSTTSVSITTTTSSTTTAAAITITTPITRWTSSISSSTTATATTPAITLSTLWITTTSIAAIWTTTLLLLIATLWQ